VRSISTSGSVDLLTPQEGAAMAKKDDQRDVNAIKQKPFSQMTRKEKMVHIGKLVLSILSFGFLFPNIGAD
jgi:hypothetical protein